MTGPKHVIGWALEDGARRELLQQFPPRYPKVVADHITFETDAPPDAPLPEPIRGEIIGRADDGAGVEALVVAIEGRTDRPDGSTWHITWSLGPGREARESNDVIAERGWTAFDLPVPVMLEPARFPGKR